MTITVSSGATRDYLTITTGDPLVVLSGGFVKNTTILDGGSATLSSGALADSFTISSGGLLLGPGDLETFISDAGLVSGATVINGEFIIMSGGVASDLANTGDLYVDAGGIATNVRDAGYMYIEARGSAVGAVDSGKLYVQGSAAGGGVDSGGVETVLLGGVTSGDSVQSGGVLVVESGGSANTLSGFSMANEAIDLSSIAFASGATATVRGTTLVLSDGGATYAFDIA
jgi:autotransporter passenger strand-loop-strand repeat protein